MLVDTNLNSQNEEKMKMEVWRNIWRSFFVAHTGLVCVWFDNSKQQ